MIRLYEKNVFAARKPLTLNEHASHHLLTVLRAKVDDKIILFNGLGGEFNATVTHLSKKQVDVFIDNFNDNTVESPLKIHLVQSLPKGDKLDFIVQKAVELGVFSITLLNAERSQGRLSKEQVQKKMARLEAIAISACEQCGRNILPILHPPVSLTSWLESNTMTDHPRYILSLGDDKTLLSQGTIPTDVSLLVGPEGGFSTAETTLAKTSGVINLTLGKRVLRTETASLAAISVMQWLYGDFQTIT